MFSHIDTGSSGIGELASGLEGFSGISPSLPNYTPSSGNRQSQEPDTPATNQVQSLGNDIALTDADRNQRPGNDDTGGKDAAMASGEAVEYASNSEDTTHASGETMESMPSVNSDSNSGQGLKYTDVAESGEKDFNIYTEHQPDDQGQLASSPGTNAFEELQDTKRSPKIPFDALVDSTGYKRDVGLSDMMVAPEYALLRPDEAADEEELVEFEELTDSLSYA